jgi:hypothetical protein
VKAEIAETTDQRRQGLMFRDSLATDRGMLFVFKKEGIYKFWMKNMRFPLDIIWISQDKRIVDIRQNAQPCQGPCESMVPAGQARFVLEVSAGFIQRHRLKIGDKAKILP